MYLIMIRYIYLLISVMIGFFSKTICNPYLNSDIYMILLCGLNP